MAETPGGVIGSAPVGFQPIGASTPTLAVAEAAGVATAIGAFNVLVPAVATAAGTATTAVLSGALKETLAASAGSSSVAATSTAIKASAAEAAGVTTVNGVAASLADAGAMSSASTNIANAVGASLAEAVGISQLPLELRGGEGGTIGQTPIGVYPIASQTVRGAPINAISAAIKDTIAVASGTVTITPVLWGSVFASVTSVGSSVTNGIGSRGFIWDFDSLDPETIYVLAEPRSMSVNNEHRAMSVMAETRSLLTGVTVKVKTNPRLRRVA